MYEVKEHLPIPTKLRKSITVDINFIRLIGENDFPDGRIFDKIDVLHFCVPPLRFVPTLYQSAKRSRYCTSEQLCSPVVFALDVAQDSSQFAGMHVA